MVSLWYMGTFCKNKKTLTEESKVECPECLEYIPIEEWEETLVECDCCGDHSGLICPRCDEIIDSVYTEEMEHKL